MELLTINLAAGQTQQFAKAGRQFEIIDSAYAVRVDFSGSQGQQTDSMTNVLSGLFIEQEFAAFAVTNGAVAQAITVLIIESGRGGSRRQPGIVRVIDSSGDKTLALRQFYGSDAQAAQALTVGCVSLLANGITVAVKKMQISSAVGGTFTFGFITGPGTATPANSPVQNKKAFAASSTARSSGGQLVATAPAAAEAPGYVQTSRLFLVANQTLEIRFENPLVISGTQGITINGTVVNRDLACAFDFEEIG